MSVALDPAHEAFHVVVRNANGVVYVANGSQMPGGGSIVTLNQ